MDLELNRTARIAAPDSHPSVYYYFATAHTPQSLASGLVRIFRRK